MKGIREKVAIVTGGASGLGAGIVRAFVAAGAKVVIADLLREQGSAIAAAHPSSCRYVRTDLRRDADVRRLIAHTAAAYGGIDFLINCACTYADSGIETTRAVWHEAFDVNVFGHAVLVREAAKYLRRSHCASVVNLASVAGTVGIPGRWVYPATKAAIAQLTRSQAADLADAGVRVNAVMPAWIDKPGAKRLAPREREQYARRARDFHILGRVARIGEITDAVLFLCSEHAGFMTGSCLQVDGGYSAMGPQRLERAIPNQGRAVVQRPKRAARRRGRRGA